ncbi:putative membrane protein [Rhodopseudomonas faecalis]|uniref:Putative membrane protein n=1 Tax=Rhodopseudomonas faecalis TaxID=99655 RepID=A0A318T798_9BRAD|nr:TIGR01620 family protein [Rhodopseudomonas faecalis]PYE99984.1 putative membrane protein [Rhodopseudomonas faecalis]TAH67343.1 MAG: TIGR01620 family protein [Rhodopseudomonas palustris]
MTERFQSRRPATFKLDDPGVVVSDGAGEEPKAAASPRPEEANRPARSRVQITPEKENLAPVVTPSEPNAALAPRRGFRWGALFWSAIGGLVSLAAWLWVTRLIEDLFAQNKTLGTVALALAIAAGVALLVIAGREVVSMMRMAAIEKLHRRAVVVLENNNRAEAKAIVRELINMEQQNPQLGRARTALTSHLDEIIDGSDLLRLAERELLGPLDQQARVLVSTAAQRVSLVTAISPKALIDVLFVLIATLRMLRQLSRLYGGRPGAIGMIRLLRQTIAHLAITGGVAIGDSVVQQMLGAGIAAKLSSKLGEGVVNGMLTARLGLAAIDLTRPLPFIALPRPVLGDLVKDLMRKRDKDKDKDKDE